MTWDGITREEFGLQLFELVKLCAAIEQLRANKNLPPSRIRPGDLTEWERREQQMIKQLPALVASLQDEELSQILARFPWVAKC